jgi:hypothetical protein
MFRLVLVVIALVAFVKGKINKILLLEINFVLFQLKIVNPQNLQLFHIQQEMQD